MPGAQWLFREWLFSPHCLGAWGGRGEPRGSPGCGGQGRGLLSQLHPRDSVGGGQQGACITVVQAGPELLSRRPPPEATGPLFPAGARHGLQGFESARVAGSGVLPKRPVIFANSSGEGNRSLSPLIRS